MYTATLPPLNTGQDTLTNNHCSRNDWQMKPEHEKKRDARFYLRISLVLRDK